VLHSEGAIDAFRQPDLNDSEARWQGGRREVVHYREHTIDAGRTRIGNRLADLPLVTWAYDGDVHFSSGRASQALYLETVSGGACRGDLLRAVRSN